eukprot:gb/GECG01014404.1/.p1 GENE.gb/GECG01014404.1/~~gb/GECG01014404.1/.p1  ORF type:complete len:1833 (+),score=195.41 gb/GECG01014404.1/:1-5499(+)
MFAAAKTIRAEGGDDGEEAEEADSSLRSHSFPQHKSASQKSVESEEQEEAQDTAEEREHEGDRDHKHRSHRRRSKKRHKSHHEESSHGSHSSTKGHRKHSREKGDSPDAKSILQQCVAPSAGLLSFKPSSELAPTLSEPSSDQYTTSVEGDSENLQFLHCAASQVPQYVHFTGRADYKETLGQKQCGHFPTETIMRLNTSHKELSLGKAKSGAFRGLAHDYSQILDQRSLAKEGSVVDCTTEVARYFTSRVTESDVVRLAYTKKRIDRLNSMPHRCASSDDKARSSGRRDSSAALKSHIQSELPYKVYALGEGMGSLHNELTHAHNIIPVEPSIVEKEESDENTIYKDDSFSLAVREKASSTGSLDPLRILSITPESRTSEYLITHVERQLSVFDFSKMCERYTPLRYWWLCFLVMWKPLRQVAAPVAGSAKTNPCNVRILLQNFSNSLMFSDRFPFMFLFDIILSGRECLRWSNPDTYFCGIGGGARGPFFLAQNSTGKFKSQRQLSELLTQRMMVLEDEFRQNSIPLFWKITLRLSRLMLACNDDVFGNTWSHDRIQDEFVATLRQLTSSEDGRVESLSAIYSYAVQVLHHVIENRKGATIVSNVLEHALERYKIVYSVCSLSIKALGSVTLSSINQDVGDEAGTLKCSADRLGVLIGRQKRKKRSRFEPLRGTTEDQKQQWMNAIENVKSVGSALRQQIEKLIAIAKTRHKEFGRRVHSTLRRMLSSIAELHHSGNTVKYNAVLLSLIEWVSSDDCLSFCYFKGEKSLESLVFGHLSNRQFDSTKRLLEAFWDTEHPRIGECDIQDGKISQGFQDFVSSHFSAAKEDVSSALALWHESLQTSWQAKAVEPTSGRTKRPRAADFFEDEGESFAPIETERTYVPHNWTKYRRPKSSNISFLDTEKELATELRKKNETAKEDVDILPSNQEREQEPTEAKGESFYRKILHDIRGTSANFVSVQGIADTHGQEEIQALPPEQWSSHRVKSFVTHEENARWVDACPLRTFVAEKTGTESSMDQVVFFEDFSEWIPLSLFNWDFLRLPLIEALRSVVDAFKEVRRLWSEDNGSDGLHSDVRVLQQSIEREENMVCSSIVEFFDRRSEFCEDVVNLVMNWMLRPVHYSSNAYKSESVLRIEYLNMVNPSEEEYIGDLDCCSHMSQISWALWTSRRSTASLLRFMRFYRYSTFIINESYGANSVCAKHQRSRSLAVLSSLFVGEGSAKMTSLDVVSEYLVSHMVFESASSYHIDAAMIEKIENIFNSFSNFSLSQLALTPRLGLLLHEIFHHGSYIEQASHVTFHKMAIAKEDLLVYYCLNIVNALTTLAHRRVKLTDLANTRSNLPKVDLGMSKKVRLVRRELLVPHTEMLQGQQTIRSCLITATARIVVESVVEGLQQNRQIRSSCPSDDSLRWLDIGHIIVARLDLKNLNSGIFDDLSSFRIGEVFQFLLLADATLGGNVAGTNVCVRMIPYVKILLCFGIAGRLHEAVASSEEAELSISQGWMIETVLSVCKSLWCLDNRFDANSSNALETDVLNPNRLGRLLERTISEATTTLSKSCVGFPQRLIRANEMKRILEPFRLPESSADGYSRALCDACNGFIRKMWDFVPIHGSSWNQFFVYNACVGGILPSAVTTHHIPHSNVGNTSVRVSMMRKNLECCYILDDICGQTPVPNEAVCKLCFMLYYSVLSLTQSESADQRRTPDSESNLSYGSSSAHFSTKASRKPLWNVAVRTLENTLASYHGAFLPSLWTWLVELYIIGRQLRQAKNAYLRAIRTCPWSKRLWTEAARLLFPFGIFDISHLRDVMDAASHRGIRLQHSSKLSEDSEDDAAEI